ncbi:ferrous iron transport protein A [Rossellomorea aquimaris]|uniref:FeoA family protein n=1 Tax=Rossellomorea TaxID=2837508 RepID=UPI001CD4B3FC|nr:FeoA family protein [Rossellomorea aquimaris]MCA1061789.1 ferrous iron transport protein A [Rossellomorea aquimaris]
MNLSQIQRNETFHISDLTELHPFVKRRLKDMGVDKGSEVKVIRYCLFGGPCLLECSGQRVGIRRKDTDCIKGERM